MTDKKTEALIESSGVLKLIANVVWRDIPKCYKETIMEVVGRIEEALKSNK
jgi:hypothetical protein